jgi:hypothetical protein
MFTTTAGHIQVVLRDKLSKEMDPRIDEGHTVKV